MPMLLAFDIETFIESLDPEKRFALIVVAVGCLTGIVITTVCVISSTVDAIHRRRIDDQLKRDMLGMGMNAEEIATVVESKSPPDEQPG